MPNIKSAKKRLRQSIKRNLRNRQAKSAVKTEYKKALTLIEVGQDKEEAAKAVREACKQLDKTAQKGILKKNHARRKKSRLMLRYNKAFAS